MNQLENLTFIETNKAMPLLTLPVRSVLVKLNQANIFLSPGSKTDREQLKSMDQITDVVGPSLFHGTGVPKAASILTSANIWGVPGLSEMKKETKFTHQLTESQWLFQDELPMVMIEGMPKCNEAVFIHKKSKSLICFDLCFNILNPKGFGSFLIYSMFGTYKKFAVSKFFLKFAEDKEDFQKSLTKIFSYDFNNVIMSHGSIVYGNGRELLLKALEKRDLKPQ